MVSLLLSPSAVGKILALRFTAFPNRRSAGENLVTECTDAFIMRCTKGSLTTLLSSDQQMDVSDVASEDFSAKSSIHGVKLCIMARINLYASSVSMT